MTQRHDDSSKPTEAKRATRRSEIESHSENSSADGEQTRNTGRDAAAGDGCQGEAASPTERPTIRQILHEAPGVHRSVRGWVRTRRRTKHVSFVEVNDGSCLSSLQVVLDGNTRVSDDAGLATGAAVVAHGVLQESPGSGQAVELLAEEVNVVGPVPAESYPLQKKRHSFEYLREIAHLRPRTNTFGAVTRVRNAISHAIHTFFQERGFFWIHTPLITSSDAEGAGSLFNVTTIDPDAPPRAEDGALNWEEDFFGKRTFLTVSGQLNVESYACSMDRVYTFGPTFRAENSNTSRHLAEFWMVEPEIAFCTLAANIDLAEEFLAEILSSVLERCPEDMAFFDKRIQPGVVEKLRGVAEGNFTRITYDEAIEHLRASGRSFEYHVEWGADLQSEHERYLTEEVFHGPVTITDYPRQIKAFYMKQNDDGRTVRAMDLLVPGLGEIIGGSERENDLDTLQRRITELGIDPEPYWWYLDLRRFGSVPHSGFGLGLERFVQYVTGMQNIRDVIPFPRAVGQCEF